MGATGRVAANASTRHPISIESQLIAIGSGFIVLLAVAALFVAVQQRRRRRRTSNTSARDFHSPLIRSAYGNTNKFRATSGSFGSNRSSPTLISPNGGGGSDESSTSSSPQCTPLTPYASFSTAVAVNEPRTCTANALAITSQQTCGGSSLSDNRGSISAAFNYEALTGTLQISILACHNLPDIQVAPNGACQLNPYVKLRLLPDNQHRVKTRILRATRNPFYDEQFTLYGITPAQLRTFTLHLSVLAWDRFSRDLVIGETFLNLADVEHRTSTELNRNALELQLYPRPAYMNVHAQILLSMAINAQTNSINFAILKAKELPCNEKIGLIDAYIKVYMLLNGQRIAKHKTHVKKRCIEPVFNESFCFELPSMLGSGTRLHSAAEILDAVSFEVQLLNHDGVTRNELVGTCIVGGNESKHWNAIKAEPGQQHAEWHRMQSVL